MRFAPACLAGLKRRLRAGEPIVIEPEGFVVPAGDDRPPAQWRSPLCLSDANYGKIGSLSPTGARPSSYPLPKGEWVLFR
jgi:hypothetical protein